MPYILIRMEMPKHCLNCSTKIDPDNSQCNIDGHVFEETLSKLTCRRDEHCPLVELPEHGDLIDRDALLKQMGITDMDCYKCEFGVHGFCGQGGEFSAACEAIEDAPAVIPSNKEETE